MEKLLKTKEVSDGLGVNPTTVQRWIKYFNIPCKTNELGHYLIPDVQLSFLKKIKEQLNSGKTMKEIKEGSTLVNEIHTHEEKMLAANVVNEKLEHMMLHIEQMERKLAVKADEVVEYQVLQHRTELDSLFELIKKIDDRMSKIEMHIEQVDQMAVGERENHFPKQLKKSKKNGLMKIFSL